MADQQDQMVLVAKLVDQVSDKLKEINKAMLATEAASKKAHEGGAKAADTHRKANELLKKSFDQIKEASADLIKPGFSALGVSAFSLAGAIGAVVDAVKDLGEQGLAFEKTSNRAGMLARQIRDLQIMGSKWGVSVDQTNESLGQFGEFMDQTARRAPDAMRAWGQMPGLWQALGSQLDKFKANHFKQAEAVLDFLPRLKYSDQKRNVLRIMGLPEDWANYSKETLREMRAYVEKIDKENPFDEAKAAKVDDAFFKLGMTFRMLKSDLGLAFSGPVTEGIEALDKWVSKPQNVERMKAAFHELAGDIEAMAEGTKKTYEALEAARKFWDAHAPKEGNDGKRIFSDKPLLDLGPFGTIDPKVGHKGTIWEDLGIDRGGSFTSPGKTGKPATLYHPSAFVTDGSFSASDTTRYVEEPIYHAMLHALQEWWQQISAGGPGGRGGAGGFQNTAFNPSDGLGGGSSGGLHGGGGYRVMPDDGGLGGSASASGSIAARRAPLMDELRKNAATRRLTEQMMATEGGAGHGQAALEALFNRTLMIRQKIPGYSLWDELHSGFYGPINRGAAQRTGISNAMHERFAKIMESVGGGSDMIAGRTDQGMVSDPNGRGPGRVNVGGRNEVYNFWHGRRRGRAQFGYGDSQRFAEQQEAMAARDRLYVSPTTASRQTDGSLLKQSQTFDGRWNDRVAAANVTVDFKNAPAWLKTAVSHDGFKELKVNRGYAAPQASDGE